jgi:hypothetical protein
MSTPGPDLVDKPRTVTDRLIHTGEHGVGYDERVLIKHRA